MSSSRKLSRQSSAKLALRIALAALAIAVGYYSITFSLARIIVKTNPELALKLAPYDGLTAAAVSQALSGPRATASERQRSDELANLSLRRDPTMASAAATLGVNADARGNAKAARRFFGYAHKLSRRNLLTQLWMIEDAVGRGNIAEALHQYDTTLRVFPKIGKLLFPVLAAASGEANIRSQLIKMLNNDPPWSEGFIDYIASNGPDPEATAVLFNGLRRDGVAISQYAQTGLVNALLAAEKADAAWSFYATIRPGAERERSRDPKFAAGLEMPSQLDWVPISDGGLTTSITPGLFDFAAPASVGGPLLQQGQLLSPGAYRFIGHSIGVNQVDPALPYWILRCSDGRELGRVVVSNSARANGVFGGSFTVPTGCPVQILILVAPPSDAISGLAGQLDRAELSPAR